MAGDTIITIVGNLTADPELRFIPSGKAVASFTVASTPRTFDRQAGEWRDGDALFLRCSVWGQAGENAAESLRRGMAVIVQGRLKQRSYEKDGQQRTVIELEVDEVGPSLRFATAVVTRASSGQQRQQQSPQSSQGYGQPQGGYGTQQPAQAPQANPWGQQQQADQPPF